MANDHATQLLLIEDDPTLAAIYTAYLKALPYEITVVNTGEKAHQIIAQQKVQGILLDINLPDINGLEILKQLKQQQYPAEVIITTSDCSMNTAIEAMKLGARDYLIKPFDKERLITTLKNTFEHQSLKKIVDTYRDEIDRRGYCGFIGSSLKMQQVYQLIDSAASSKATIFITGESGTGKEVCAEAIHQRSDRAKAPFIALNCGAIPKDLIESEIFGHIKGAFTGAVNNRDGVAKAADGGTLFLDEICEMDMSLQSKLLRFLQTGTLQKVGSDKTEHVDVRIICATNKDPLQQIAEGFFREDLFYRLHVLPIILPPLRDRDNDIIEIAQHFLTQYAAEENKDFTHFDTETEIVLSQYHWPGNVRQLQNVIRNIVVLSNAVSVGLNMLPAPLDNLAFNIMDNDSSHRFKPSQQPVSTPEPRAAFSQNQQTYATTNPATINSAPANKQSLQELITPLADLEKEAIEQAILLCDGNIPAAAHYLGISAATVYRKRNTWKTS